MAGAWNLNTRGLRLGPFAIGVQQKEQPVSVSFCDGLGAKSTPDPPARNPT